ncbi:tetratricopeptide repeat protein [Flavobacterium sp. C4GT6]|uniref:tetratricopeptide repeat protein n=1 Tax=Flavobacterium sp. C4GT6 TaxID=3103818 RepID=UPI002ECFBBB2
MKRIFLILIVLFTYTGLQAQEYAKRRVKKGKAKTEQEATEQPDSQKTMVTDTVAKEVPVDDEFEKLMRRGAKEVSTRKYLDAIATFNKAMAYNRETARVLRCRGEAFYSSKDYLSAIKDYTEAIELGTDYPGEVYYSRAMCKAKLTEPDYEGACIDFKKAKELGFTIEGRDVISLYCN